jgi:hypothetical protein
MAKKACSRSAEMAWSSPRVMPACQARRLRSGAKVAGASISMAPLTRVERQPASVTSWTRRPVSARLSAAARMVGELPASRSIIVPLNTTPPWSLITIESQAASISASR